MAVTRNRILQETQGEFVALFDNDDESLQTRVEKQLIINGARQVGK